MEKLNQYRLNLYTYLHVSNYLTGLRYRKTFSGGVSDSIVFTPTFLVITSRSPRRGIKHRVILLKDDTLIKKS